ncbi:MAG: tyrosine--tRNA ligase [Fibromonadaceae bacterium]|jgi:tyrosyl-tRNA synthetase|nr:tyrosine--tRNA ligase [Fibromonadaceae bacterium]
MKFLPLKDQMSLLMRGVQEVVPENDFEKKLQKSLDTGIPLRIKLGVDPTAPDIHLGHTVVMRKLRQFQDLGHQVVLIVGDYTAMIGDPSGRNQTRPRLSHEQVMENAKEYQEQFFKIVKKEQTEVRHNGDWFSKMSFEKVTELAGSITIAQMLEREDFKNRYANKQPISLHEFLYPLMQGYDSIEIESDVEIGGTDQKFNVLRGRDLQLRENKELQVGLFMPILLGTDGKQKMSKSLGNYVGINESADVMYHKIYNIPDSLAESWFELLTDKPKNEIADLLKGDILAAKKALALDIVSQYHGEQAAEAAGEKEKSVHSGNIDWENPSSLPDDAVVKDVEDKDYTNLDILDLTEAFSSKGEARRMLANNGVKFNGKIITNANENLDRNMVKDRCLVQIGKRKFFLLNFQKPK